MLWRNAEIFVAAEGGDAGPIQGETNQFPIKGNNRSTGAQAAGLPRDYRGVGASLVGKYQGGYGVGAVRIRLDVNFHFGKFKNGAPTSRRNVC